MRLSALLLLAATACGATLTPEEKASNLESFEYVWATIRDKHWDKSLDGPEWKAVHDELRPKLEQAESSEAARNVLKEMIGRLHLTHFNVIPGDIYSELHGDTAGMDVRLLNGQAVLVSGKHRGWEIQGVSDVVTKIQKLYEHSTMQEMMTVRAVTGAIGAQTATLSDGQGNKAAPDPGEFAPRGEPAVFGNLPTQYVWTESRQIGKSGYFAFNMFLDPGRLIPQLAAAIQSCKECAGFVIDLRGNPGGIAAMAMGMAGFFIEQQGQLLGTMQLRDNALKFVINPRSPHFNGRLAVLVDGLSASTSEIFAGGLQDLGRARIFGTRTAGAALPSVIERLPNGDAFQYAIANYVSKGGTVLEGKGVIPDVEVRPTRAALLAGRDAVLERALEWVEKTP